MAISHGLPQKAKRLFRIGRDAGGDAILVEPGEQYPCVILLLDGIKRIAENLGRAAGLPEDKLPEVRYSDSTPPTINDAKLARRFRKMWMETMGAEIVMDDAFVAKHNKGMGAEDFPFFTTDPPIPSVYFEVGGTPKADIDAEAAGGPKVPSHHSPFFKISPEPSIKTGVEATVLALLDLMKK